MSQGEAYVDAFRFGAKAWRTSGTIEEGLALISNGKWVAAMGQAAVWLGVGVLGFATSYVGTAAVVCAVDPTYYGT
jgi:hypothetical protein